MNTHIANIAVFCAAVLCFLTCQSSDAQSITWEEATELHLTTLTLDDSHDLLRIRKDGDEVEFEIYMFDANIFDDVPNTLDFELLEDLATEYYDFDVDLEDLGNGNPPGLNVYLGGGNDIVYTDQDLELRLGIAGGDGDDYIQGGMMSDFLWGGNGSDQIYGFGGNDFIGGGGFTSLEELEDGERDYLSGGLGADSFFQTRYQIFTGYRVSGLGGRGTTPTVTRNWIYFPTDSLLDYQSWEDSIFYPLEAD